MRGIDVSSHDGWNGSAYGSHTESCYRDSDFVIIKATQGTHYVNPAFDAQADRVLADGKLLGLYHYAADSDDAAAEAQYFHDRYKAYRGRAVAVLDWESYQNAAWGNTTWSRRFADRFHELSGVWPMLYTGMDGCRQCASCADVMPLWFAGYPRAARDSWDVPAWPSSYSTQPWGGYTIWQYTSDGGTDRNTAPIDAAKWKEMCGDMGKYTAEDVVRIARGEVGYHEGSNNHTKYGDEMSQFPEMDRNAPWCDAFVDWCHYHASGCDADAAQYTLCGAFDDYTVTSASYFKREGRYDRTPKYGDQVFFRNSGGICHTGIVVGVDGDTVRTIEGNKSDAVRECSYRLSDSYIDGFGHPRYSNERSASVWMYTPNNTDAQKFVPSWDEDGYVTLTSVACGLALDVVGASAKSTTPVQVYTPNGSDAQKWKLAHVKDTGYRPSESRPWTLAPKCAPKMRLDVIGASTAVEAGIQIYKANDSAAQSFAVVDTGEGSWVLINPHSSLAIDVKHAGN